MFFDFHFRPVPPPAGQPWDLSRSPTVRSKVIALDQIHFMLNYYGSSVISKFEMFLNYIEQNLMSTVIRSSVIAIPMVSELAFDLINDLFVHFRVRFKVISNF